MDNQTRSMVVLNKILKDMELPITEFYYNISGALVITSSTIIQAAHIDILNHWEYACDNEIDFIRFGPCTIWATF